MKLLLKTLFALLFLFSLSPFLAKPSLAEITHETNPQENLIDETTHLVTLTLQGVSHDTTYYYCESADSSYCISHPIKELNSDSSGNLNFPAMCADGSIGLTNEDCNNNDVYFQGGNDYGITLYEDDSPLSDSIYVASFYVKRFYPDVTLGENQPSDGRIKPTVASTRRPHNDGDRNNYDIVVQSQGGGGYDEDKCVTATPDGIAQTPQDMFPQLTRAGKYVAYFREQTNENERQDRCQSPSGFLYWNINFRVDGTGKITNVGSPLKDPEGDDTSALLGKNPCRPHGSGPVVCPTAIGPIAADPKTFVERILAIATGLAGGIALIFMVIGSIKVLTSSGDQQKLNTGKDQIVAAVAGLLFLIFSVLILRFFGLVLNIPFL